MVFKFAANISTLFHECGPNLTERLVKATAFGFKRIEVQFPYAQSIDEWTGALGRCSHRPEIALMNSPPGDRLGCAIYRETQDEFKQSLETALSYAQLFNCSKIHVMAGKVDETVDRQVYLETYEKNLGLAADFFRPYNIDVLIEAINDRVSVPNYFMNSPRESFEVVKKLDRSNLFLLLDLFHLQMTEGCIVENLKSFLPLTRHIQVAQAPHRAGPAAAGELDFEFLFKTLDDVGYDGTVGLEYVPRKDLDGSTEDSLQWIGRWGLAGRL